MLRIARMRLKMRCPGITMANKRVSVCPEDDEVGSKFETIWFPSAVPKRWSRDAPEIRNGRFPTKRPN